MVNRRPGFRFCASLIKVPKNQIKKLFDLEETRRVSCRYVNATIPKKSPRIYITNSEEGDFYPKMKPQDEKGVKRRQDFVTVTRDVRRQTADTLPSDATATVAGTGRELAWELQASATNAQLAEELRAFLQAAQLMQYCDKALAWCLNAGAITIKELLGYPDHFANALNLKFFERQRFNEAVRNFM